MPNLLAYIENPFYTIKYTDYFINIIGVTERDFLVNFVTPNAILSYV
jgi:hypothetical protein